MEEAADKLISSKPQLKTNESLLPDNSIHSPWLIFHADINNPNSKTSLSHDQHPLFQTSSSDDYYFAKSNYTIYKFDF